MSNRRIYIAEKHDGNFHSGNGIWQEAEDGASPNFVGKISEVHDDHVIGRVNDGEPTRFDFVGERFDDVDDDRCQAIEKFVEQPAKLDRLYVVEENSGKFCVGHRIWKEAKTPHGLDGVGRITEVHEDYIVGRLDDNDEYVRFDFVGERFHDSDGDRSQAIEQAAQAEEKQPAKPFEPIDDETMFITLKRNGSVDNRFSSVWEHSRGRDDKLMCVVVASIKTVNEDHIIANFRNNGSIVETDVRLNITNNKFRDCSQDYAVEVVKPAQPAVQAEIKPAPAVGQYVFEEGKFFGKVVKGDNEHIRIDSHDDIREWFAVCDVDHFEFHAIKPGMKAAPKTSGIGFTIDSVVEEPCCGSKASPLVVFSGGRNILLSKLVKDYDLSVPPADQPHANIPLLGPDKYLDPKPRGNHESRMQPAQPVAVPTVYDEYGLVLYLGYDVFYKQTGEVLGKITELHPDNQITMEFTPGVTDDTVVQKKNTIPCYNPRLGKGADPQWGFCPSNWGTSDSDRILRIDRLETAEEADPEPHGRMSCREQKLSPIQLSERISEIADNVLPKYLPALASRWVVDDEFETQIHVSDAVFLKETGKVIGHVTKLRDDNQLDIKFRPDLDLDLDLGLSLTCYNPRMPIVNVDELFGFHRSGQFGSDLERTDYILGCNLIAHPEQSTQPQVEVGSRVYRHEVFWCDVVAVNGERSEVQYAGESTKTFHVPTNTYFGTPYTILPPVTHPAHAKLRECDVTDTDAWLSRNRPPVDLQNGDTIVTNTGIYRLHDNKWVKIAGKLRVRCHESIVDDSRNVVEYKFVSDPLLIKERDERFEDATATVREVLEWGDTMLSDLRPKGKPLTTHNED